MSRIAPAYSPPAVNKRPMRRAFVGGACLSLQPLLLSALMLPATAYVIRALGPTAYGQWATATAIVGVVTFVTNLGLRGAFVRSIARAPESAEAAFAEQLGARTVLALLAAVLAVALSLALHNHGVVLACTVIAAAGLLLMVVASTAADTLQAMHQLPTVAGVNVVSGLCLTVASVSAVYFGGGTVAVALSYLTGSAVSAVLLLYLIGRRHFRPRVRWNLRRCMTLISGARFLGSQQFVFSVAGNAEALLIPRLVGHTMFGYFSTGTLLANRLSAIPDGLCSAAYPAMVAAHRHGPRAVLPVFARFLALVAATCVTAAWLVHFLAPWIAGLIFPGHSDVVEQVMRITIWLLPVMGVYFCVGYLFNALEMDVEQARASLVGSITSLALTGVLVWNFGIVGACWSMLLRYVLHLAAYAVYFPKIYRKLTQDAPTTPAAAGGLLITPAMEA